MKSTVEFKEKPFEHAFASEVARMTRATFSPDLRDEYFLGFDGAYFIPDTEIFRLAPYRRVRRFRKLTGIAIKEFEFVAAELSSRMPPFRFNVFAQYKRPDFLSSPGAGQWADWKKPYFRYETTPHQHELLVKIEKNSAGRAAAIYASPAFRSANDLWTFVGQGKVIDNSNIACAQRLTGHEKYSYVAPGHFGRGHSETEELESQPLAAIINQGLEANEELPFNQHLKRIARIVSEAIREDEIRSTLFDTATRAIDPAYVDIQPNTLLWAMMTLDLAGHIFDMSAYLIP